MRRRPANSIRDRGIGLIHSPDLWPQSLPSCPHRLDAWQIGGVHLCPESRTKASRGEAMVVAEHSPAAGELPHRRSRSVNRCVPLDKIEQRKRIKARSRYQYLARSLVADRHRHRHWVALPWSTTSRGHQNGEDWPCRKLANPIAKLKLSLELIAPLCPIRWRSCLRQPQSFFTATRNVGLRSLLRALRLERYLPARAGENAAPSPGRPSPEKNAFSSHKKRGPATASDVRSARMEENGNSYVRVLDRRRAIGGYQLAD